MPRLHGALAPRFWVEQLLLPLLLCAEAFARAGGGGGYGGGGGSSGGGGSGGGSGGGGILIELIFRLYIPWVIQHPVPGIPTTLVLIYLVYATCDAGKTQYVARTIRRGAEAQDFLRRRENLDRLTARDPRFEERGFLSRVQSAFLKIQRAWCAMDLSAARAFISDGVRERFELQLAMQKARGTRDRMESLRILEARVIEIDAGAQFDALHVYFRASASDVEVSLKDQTVVKGDGVPEEFEEVWSFLRRPGAVTLERPGLIEGNCPSCGAGLELADSVVCPSCKSWVNSGEYDWVLSEITQACEWSSPGAPQEVPGFARLAEDDPGLNVQFIEDRASVAFWRWRYALWDANPEWLRSVALDGLCDSMAPEIRAKPPRPADTAVGGVTVLALEAGEACARAHVEVKWSAGNSMSRHVLVFQRKAGVKTDVHSGLLSLHCPGCGAPAKSRDAARCDYCRASLNDGSRHWVLAELVPRSSWTLPAGLAAARRPGPEGAAAPTRGATDLEWGADLSPVDAVAVLVASMLADGDMGPKELAHLQAYVRKRGVPLDAYARTVNAAKAGALQIPRPQTAEQAASMLRGLIKMSLADGKLSRSEVRLIQGFAASVSIPPAQARYAIREETSLMYRSAKAALAARRELLK